jgi:hypothetical protein
MNVTPAPPRSDGAGDKRLIARNPDASRLSVAGYSLFPIPYSLFPIPYSLFPIPYSLFPIPYSLFPAVQLATCRSTR